jgi:hypothetical protein
VNVERAVGGPEDADHGGEPSDLDDAVRSDGERPGFPLSRRGDGRALQALDLIPQLPTNLVDRIVGLDGDLVERRAAGDLDDTGDGGDALVGFRPVVRLVTGGEDEDDGQGA